MGEKKMAERTVVCAAPAHSQQGGTKVSHSPFITIAIPTYNRASLLEACVRSALAQTYEKFEVLVSDNSSTDNTVEVVHEFDDRRLRLVQQKENIGLLGNWNACLNQARGEYTVFVSDDDHISANFLERCAPLINSEPNVPIVVALSNIFIERLNRTVCAIPNRRLHTGIWPGTQILTEFLGNRVHTNICTILFRTDALRTLGGFSSEFTCADDIAALLSMLLLGRAGLVNEACGAHTMHDDSATSRLSISALIEDDQKVAEFVSRRAQQDIADEKERQRINRECRRWVARNAIRNFGDARRQGVSFVSVAALMWRWRRCLAHLSAGDIVNLTQPIARIAMPHKVAIGLARIKALARKSRA